MPRKRIDQPVALFLEDGSVLQSEYMESSPEGVRLSAGRDLEKIVILSPDQKIIHLQKLGEDRKIVSNTLVKEKNRLALALLTLERWTQEFRQLSGDADFNPELVLYGSGSLNITIVPDETSHDLDVAAVGSFLRFCDEKSKLEPVGGEFRTLEINLARLDLTFEYLGRWRARASRLIGAFSLELLVLHPLDTISQKLLRLSEPDFEERDLRHIRKVLEVLRPTSDTMESILLEGVGRYSNPYPAAAKASRRNTKRFLAEFFPDLTLNAIIRKFVRAQEENLRYIQQGSITPLPEQDWEALLDVEEAWE